MARAGRIHPARGPRNVCLETSGDRRLSRYSRCVGGSGHPGARTRRSRDRTADHRAFGEGTERNTRPEGDAQQEFFRHIQDNPGLRGRSGRLLGQAAGDGADCGHRAAFRGAARTRPSDLPDGRDIPLCGHGRPQSQGTDRPEPLGDNPTSEADLRHCGCLQFRRHHDSVSDRDRPRPADRLRSLAERGDRCDRGQ